MQDVKFYNDTKSWKEAANFCFVKGRVLESSVTLLSEHFSYITHNGERKETWLGKSKLQTNWTYIRGQVSGFDNEEQEEHCIAVKCDRGNLKRSSKMCEGKQYDVTCDNGLELKISMQTTRQQQMNVQGKALLSNGIRTFPVILMINNIDIGQVEHVTLKYFVLENHSSENEKDTVDGHINNKTCQPVVYHEIEVENFSPHSGKFKYPQTVNNITYDYPHSNCSPKLRNVNQSAINSIQANVQSNELNYKGGQKEYEMAKVQNLTRDSSETANSSNVCLAKPKTSNKEDESDPYDINRDYNHLYNVRKKEDQITKVYDHLPTTVTDDPTYDHSNLKSVSDNGYYYDHFKIDEADV
ncbi:unnamed protein product [Mytilus coruscus]|uniref:C-type lectin domain-containing protein n=1 Tax=Mytilus coruscus TaxID=42192 RepID=A0A6J8CIY9_MYTCO|nr:unnamed protein product [Mytilus coruscus]